MGSIKIEQLAKRKLGEVNFDTVSLKMKYDIFVYLHDYGIPRRAQNILIRQQESGGVKLQSPGTVHSIRVRFLISNQRKIGLIVYHVSVLQMQWLAPWFSKVLSRNPMGHPRHFQGCMKSKSCTGQRFMWSSKQTNGFWSNGCAKLLGFPIPYSM